MLGQRRRRWYNIKSGLSDTRCSNVESTSMTLIQRRKTSCVQWVVCPCLLEPRSRYSDSFFRHSARRSGVSLSMKSLCIIVECQDVFSHVILTTSPRYYHTVHLFTNPSFRLICDWTMLSTKSARIDFRRQNLNLFVNRISKSYLSTILRSFKAFKAESYSMDVRF